MSMRNNKPKRPMQAYWPVFGLLLALALGAISWAVTPATFDWLGTWLKGFPPAGVPRSTLELIITVIIFAVLGLFASLLVAMGMPKKKSAVNEKQLTEARAEMIQEKRMRRLRQKQMNKSRTRE